MGCPQQTRIPLPDAITFTMLPQILRAFKVVPYSFEQFFTFFINDYKMMSECLGKGNLSLRGNVCAKPCIVVVLRKRSVV